MSFCLDRKMSIPYRPRCRLHASMERGGVVSTKEDDVVPSKKDPCSGVLGGRRRKRQAWLLLGKENARPNLANLIQ